MATIRKKGGSMARAGAPLGLALSDANIPSRKKAEEWARDVESQMDRVVFVDRSEGKRATLGDPIKIYIKEVTEKRPGAASRAAEKSRLKRFMRDEPKLGAYAIAHLRPEHFEEYRYRRLAEFATRGKPGGRGQYKPEKPKPGRFRKDGTPRANAAPKPPPKPPKKIAPGTVTRELTLLKRSSITASVALVCS